MIFLSLSHVNILDLSCFFQCYIETLNTMVTLQNQYLESKNEKNIFQRYSLLRAMIKVICGIFSEYQE